MAEIAVEGGSDFCGSELTSQLLVADLISLVGGQLVPLWLVRV